MAMWQVVILGICIVFICLVSLIIITTLMSAFVKGTAKEEKAVATVAPAPAPVVQAVAPNVDKQALIAAIGACIADDMGTDVSAIRIHSIKKI